MLLRKVDLDAGSYQPAAVPHTVNFAAMTTQMSLQLPYSVARNNLLQAIHTTKEPSAEILNEIRAAMNRMDAVHDNTDWIDTLSHDLGVQRD